MDKKTCYQKPVVELVFHYDDDIIVSSSDDNVQDSDIIDMFIG